MEDSEVARAFLYLMAFDEGLTEVEFDQIESGIIDGINYGRQTPDREMLARLIRFAVIVHSGTAYEVIDQFLQSEASKVQGEK